MRLRALCQNASHQGESSDKKDAKKLARLLRAGELEPIHMPSTADEAVRDLCRARTDAVQARRRAKKQLLGFMLRNGMSYSGKTHWTQGHLNYIRKIAMPDPVQQIVLEEYIMEIDALEERVARLTRHMDEQLEAWGRKPMVDALMGLRGLSLLRRALRPGFARECHQWLAVQVVTAMTIIAELGDLDRFATPRQLMGYLGLVPGEDSSGERRRQGAITNVSSVAFSEGGDRQLPRTLDARRVRQRLREEGDGVARALEAPGGPDPRGQGPILARADAPLLPPPQALRPQDGAQQSHHRPRP